MNHPRVSHIYWTAPGLWSTLLNLGRVEERSVRFSLILKQLTAFSIKTSLAIKCA